MVRFIIDKLLKNINEREEIYIPIWLDLLFIEYEVDGIPITNLHSNMVRFIIFSFPNHLYLHIKIYIPIWLDLL